MPHYSGKLCTLLPNGLFHLAKVLFVSVIFVAGLADAAPAQKDELVCVLLTKEGKVEVSTGVAIQWSTARTNQVLHPGDRLRTGLRNERSCPVMREREW